jgi:hypothetical protein
LFKKQPKKADNSGARSFYPDSPREFDPIIRNGVLTRQWFESGEIWEYLIEGRLELVDEGDEGAPKTEVSFRRSRENKTACLMSQLRSL